MSDPRLDRRRALVLATLFAGAFVMGAAEMLVVGLIDRIADDLRVSLPAAGALVTANAIGLAVGGPILTFLTARLDRRTVVLAATAVFLLGNLLPAIAADHPVFLVVRVVVGAAQGLFIAAAITTATSIVPPERAGRAMSVVIAGFASASAFGLPLGTLLGQAVGWRGSFVAVVAIAALVLAAAVVLAPSVPAGREQAGAGAARAALAPRVLAVLAVCILVFTAIQSAVTYLVPFLADVTRIPDGWASAFLLAYGVATTLGSSLGGRFADANAGRALVIGSTGVLLSLLVLFAFGGHVLAAAAAVLGIGLFGMGMAPSLQHRVTHLAGPGAALASSLPASAVNVGIAAGSLLGGVALDGVGIGTVPLVGAAVAVAAIAAAAASARLRPAPSAAPRTFAAN